MSSPYNRSDHDTKRDDNKPLKNAFPRLHYTYTDRQKWLKDEVKHQKSFEQKSTKDQSSSYGTTSTHHVQPNQHHPLQTEKNIAKSPVINHYDSSTIKHEAPYLTSVLPSAMNIQTSKPMHVPFGNGQSSTIRDHSPSRLYTTNPVVVPNITPIQHEGATRKLSPAHVYQRSLSPNRTPVTDPMPIARPAAPTPINTASPVVSSLGPSPKKLSSSSSFTARSFYEEHSSPPKSSNISSSSSFQTSNSNSSNSNEKKNVKPNIENSSALYITRTSRSNSNNEVEKSVKLREPTTAVKKNTSRPPSAIFEPSPRTLPDYYQPKKANNPQQNKRWQTVNFDSSQENRVAAQQASILVDQAKNNKEVIKKAAEKVAVAKKPIVIPVNNNALTTNGVEDEEFRNFLKNIKERKNAWNESKNWEGALVGRLMDNVRNVTTLTISETNPTDQMDLQHLYYEETDIPFFENEEDEQITEFANKLVEDIFSDLENIDLFGHILSHRLENLDVNYYDDDYAQSAVMPTISEDAKQFFTPRNSVE